MYIEPKIITLSNGWEVILKSPDISETATLLKHMRQTSAETHFMVRYPEEIDRTEDTERLYIKPVLQDEAEFALAAFLDGELVGIGFHNA